MITFKSDAFGLAVTTALEELQEAAENMTTAIDNMKGMDIDLESWEFLDKLWQGCMEICDRDTCIEGSSIDPEMFVVAWSKEG